MSIGVDGGRLNRKVAPRGSSISSSRPPIRAASSEPIASPSPNPLPSPLLAPRWKRSKISSRSSARARPDPRRRPRSPASSRSTAIRTLTVVWAARSVARCRAGSGRCARRCLGRPAPRSDRRVSSSATLTRVLRASARTRPRPRVRSRRARPARCAARGCASIRLRSSRSLASELSRRAWRRADATRSRASPRSTGSYSRSSSSSSSAPSSEVERRAQLMRCGCDERAPRILLLSQPLVHRREAAGDSRSRRAPRRGAPRAR